MNPKSKKPPLTTLLKLLKTILSIKDKLDLYEQNQTHPTLWPKLNQKINEIFPLVLPISATKNLKKSVQHQLKSQIINLNLEMVKFLNFMDNSQVTEWLAHNFQTIIVDMFGSDILSNFEILSFFEKILGDPSSEKDTDENFPALREQIVQQILLRMILQVNSKNSNLSNLEKSSILADLVNFLTRLNFADMLDFLLDSIDFEQLLQLKFQILPPVIQNEIIFKILKYENVDATLVVKQLDFYKIVEILGIFVGPVICDDSQQAKEESSPENSENSETEAKITKFLKLTSKNLSIFQIFNLISRFEDILCGEILLSLILSLLHKIEQEFGVIFSLVAKSCTLDKEDLKILINNLKIKVNLHLDEDSCSFVKSHLEENLTTCFKIWEES